MSIIGIIPARYASSRFPGKPLVEIKGKSMLERVYTQAKKSSLLTEIIIATDDKRIEDHALSFGAKVVITKEEHPSGTDRCFEAYTLNGKQYDYILNIQGDEPFLDPEQINSLAEACNSDVQIATQMIKCTSYDVLFDKGEVKIILNSNKEALYFSRNVIPFIKNKEEKEWHLHYNYFRHVGMYAYRADILEKITLLAPSDLEKAESLEQLRWLENGFKIKCIETSFDSHCIDTPEDIDKVLKLMGI
ncbi:MAG: 3-deoxy-manno-octulosonate cytidylyltransferase [Bacteroidetes bacterium]|nr:3-deoxy-manno-octulosonate cytidylyltransferase [Bacteroidota bacterium]